MHMCVCVWKKGGGEAEEKIDSLRPFLWSEKENHIVPQIPIHTPLLPLPQFTQLTLTYQIMSYQATL